MTEPAVARLANFLKDCFCSSPLGNSVSFALDVTTSREFTPFPGVDLMDVYRFLDRQRPH